MKSEKLIIENFGPIKKAEIDLKQVMLFIGPQGSGKSTILKLIAALRELLHAFYKIDYLKNNKEEIERYKDIYFKNYGIYSYFNPDTYIQYQGIYNDCEFKGTKFELKSNKNADTNMYPSYFPYYIPAEKAFLYTYLNIVNTLLIKEIPIPYILKNFASLFESARNFVQYPKLPYLDVQYKFENGQDRVYFDSEHFVPLSESSSGIQTSIPLGIVIESIKYKYQYGEDISKSSSVFIEEPELNLFPSTQKKLVEFIFDRLVQFHEKKHLVYIETHSPYILTSIDNLIQAGNVYNDKGKSIEIEKQITAFIPKNCWIDFDKVSAYYIENGKAKSILDYEAKRITADAIDRVSEDIALDFDKLLDLKYSS